jgi:hypothetical protein
MLLVVAMASLILRRRQRPNPVPPWRAMLDPKCGQVRCWDVGPKIGQAIAV